MNSKSAFSVRIQMSQRPISELEASIHSDSTEQGFRSLMFKVNDEAGGLVKYFRKNEQMLEQFAEKHIPLQKTDIFIEGLLHYCTLEILSLNNTAIALPVIFHVLILYKHPVYYSILHKGLTLEEFNHVKSNIISVFRAKFPHIDTNNILKHTSNIVNNEIKIGSNIITEIFNYFVDFDYKRNLNKILFDTDSSKGFSNKPLPVLNNDYYPAVYYTKAEIMKKTNSKGCKYVLLLNPYANQKLPLNSVEYNNDVPGIDHIIYKDNTFHGLYRLRMRNLKEPAFELWLFNGKDFHIICKGAAEEMKEMFSEKRIDNIPITIYLSFNIWDEKERSNDNIYVKLICKDIYPKLNRSLKTITSIEELVQKTRTEAGKYEEEVRLNGELIKKYIDGYAIRTIDLNQFMYLINREIIRNSIYTHYPKRNPEMKASFGFREENDKMSNYRKILNTMLNDTNYRFKDIFEVKAELLKRVHSFEIDIEQKMLYERLLEGVIKQIKFPLDEAGMERLTTFNSSIIG